MEKGAAVPLGDGYLCADRILDCTRFDGVAVDADCLAGTPQLHQRIAFGNEQARIVGLHAESRSTGDEFRERDAAGSRRLEPGFGSGGLVQWRRSRACRGNDRGQDKNGQSCEVHWSISRTTRKPTLLLR